MSEERIVINVYGDEAAAQAAWKLITATFRLNDVHADAVLFDGPLYTKSVDGYVEVKSQDKRQ